MNQRNHNRAPDKTQTSIAVPKSLLEQIQTLADKELRTRNNMITVLLKEALSLKQGAVCEQATQHIYQAEKDKEDKGER